MKEKNKISEKISKYLFLNNIKEKNNKGEVERVFRFIINKDKINKFLDKKND